MTTKNHKKTDTLTSQFDFEQTSYIHQGMIQVIRRYQRLIGFEIGPMTAQEAYHLDHDRARYPQMIRPQRDGQGRAVPTWHEADAITFIADHSEMKPRNVAAWLRMLDPDRTNGPRPANSLPVALLQGKAARVTIREEKSGAGALLRVEIEPSAGGRRRAFYADDLIDARRRASRELPEPLRADAVRCIDQADRAARQPTQPHPKRLLSLSI